MALDFVFQVAILLMSVVVHEVAHGVMADKLGDPTARYQGRLTLNPIPHIDLFGSIIVPLASYFTAGFIFGWAKPVPYNPHNLRPGKFSELLVALAGPLANFAIAIIFGILIRVGVGEGYSQAFITITSSIVYLNVLLGIFNLMPIPPLDGSKIIYALFPSVSERMRSMFERSGFTLVILFVLFFSSFISPLVALVFRLITGLRG
ncbi:site-2 protease family protein [Candidatus Parcubacteria bacterium]|nr:site-2 protease family protein [Candidatus Parcubacteria bacterium]